MNHNKCGIELIFAIIKFANSRLFSYSRDPLIFAEKTPCTCVQFTVGSFTFDSVIRGYKKSELGKNFCRRDKRN